MLRKHKNKKTQTKKTTIFCKTQLFLQLFIINKLGQQKKRSLMNNEFLKINEKIEKN